MKTPKCLSVALLSATLAFAPISVSANAIPIPASTAEPIQLPKVDAKDLAKKIAKVGRTNAVAFAVDKLFEGIDWVMDPANNQAITKNKIYCQSHAICVDNLAEAETYALQSTFVTEWKYPFTGCQFHDNWGNGVIACTFTQDGDIRTIVFYNEGQKIATYDQIAQEILNNALQGHLDSIKFVQEVAEEKAKEEGQPIAPPANPPLNPPVVPPQPISPPNTDPTTAPPQPIADSVGKPVTQPIRRSAQCDAEWDKAYEICENSMGLDDFRYVTGKDIDKCARGLVSQECGGNKVVW